jgi:Fic family protein
LAKSQFWYCHAQTVLSARQIKVLNRLLDNLGDEFIGGINASKYKGIAGVSIATATRELTELLKKNCIIQLDGGGRSTRYNVNIQL